MPAILPLGHRSFVQGCKPDYQAMFWTLLTVSQGQIVRGERSELIVSMPLVTSLAPKLQDIIDQLINADQNRNPLPCRTTSTRNRADPIRASSPMRHAENHYEALVSWNAWMPKVVRPMTWPHASFGRSSRSLLRELEAQQCLVYHATYSSISRAQRIPSLFKVSFETQFPGFEACNVCGKAVNRPEICTPQAPQNSRIGDENCMYHAGFQTACCFDLQRSTSPHLFT
ncbi:uncharacterized protein MYCFIDRAFT_171097 [Pseudocercospora fijiensis CIRAD86]|uniref:Uncharacterized protein n=1 Tax=Pseudocercospora fijiensis (strain CIRAD86) TaxID=383855 RepID=N1QBV9_PSEFD|nr:uncharacterized protein MYCFIDRAFT_171097 [Pseudocercospora fijiensis CIRAD86]EME89686.1 hypothetical protein MYCFIDRAFT_171097 [Pseudocercospora fijiensis CIRAD86]